MEVKLDKRYPIEASPAQVWAVLRDVRSVAGCMPGAAITDQIDATHYKGAVKVKIGPALAAFAGDIEVLALDEASHSTQLLGKGADRSGSTAAMNLSARVEPGEAAGQSVLVGEALVTVNGKFAQFGSRMMVQVGDMILGQFADNFRIAAAAIPAPEPQEGAVAVASIVTVTTTDSETGSVVNATTVTAAVSTPAPTVAASAPPPKATTELNALAIAWMLVKNWFARLFGKRT
jgi:carbon monoxide dehydrogenase subunit G